MGRTGGRWHHQAVVDTSACLPQVVEVASTQALQNRRAYFVIGEIRIEYDIEKGSMATVKVGSCCVERWILLWKMSH